MDCLLLNNNYLPLEIISWKDAMRLMFEEKATVVTFYEDWKVNSASQEWAVPAVMALKRHISFDEQIKFSRENIYIRDGFACQYCHRVFRPSDLELEHVVPESRGGKKCFENIVTSCRECNKKKANKTPEEAGMLLKKAAKRPSNLQYRMYKIARRMKHPSWKDYAGLYSTFIDANGLRDE